MPSPHDQTLAATVFPRNFNNPDNNDHFLSSAHTGHKGIMLNLSLNSARPPTQPSSSRALLLLLWVSVTFPLNTCLIGPSPCGCHPHPAHVTCDSRPVASPTLCAPRSGHPGQTQQQNLCPSLSRGVNVSTQRGLEWGLNTSRKGQLTALRGL